MKRPQIQKVKYNSLEKALGTEERLGGLAAPVGELEHAELVVHHRDDDGGHVGDDLDVGLLGDGDQVVGVRLEVEAGALVLREVRRDQVPGIVRAPARINML